MSAADPFVLAFRRFNRFYTRRIGVLAEHPYGSSYSLAEVRVLYELANRDGPTATDLRSELGLDAGYTSRILRKLEDGGLVRRQRSRSDGRRAILSLTAKGRRVVAGLDAKSSRHIAELLGPLSASDRARLTGALACVEDVLGAPPGAAGPSVAIRPHGPGDLGWIVQAHGALYDREYGWDETFEALVAGIVAKFGERHDPARERCWIAELGGANVGSVMCCRESDAVARLRLLLVDPRARGRGVGARLVGECVRFARGAGYRRVVLWTNDVLTAARRIYERAGFALTHEEAHRSFGKDLVGQTWELELG